MRGEVVTNLGRGRLGMMATPESRPGLPSVMTGGRASTVLRDGTVGYYMERPDDCFRAAVATCLQVPPHQVPDLQLDARLARGEDPVTVDRTSRTTLVGWARRRGLRIVTHNEVPACRGRWIGVITPERVLRALLAAHGRCAEEYRAGELLQACGPFTSHCLVLSGATVLHDPLDDGGTGLARIFFRADDVAFGYSFREEEW